MRSEDAPDPQWVADLTGVGLAPARAAIEEATGERPLFDHLAAQHAAEGRESYVEIDAPLELHALVRLLHPRHVLEVGVSSGVSSAYLLNALERNGEGTLHSIDLPSRPPRPRTGGGPTRSSWSLPPGRDSGWAVPFKLRRRWDLRLGDKSDGIPLLVEELPRIDLLVYDVPHEDRGTRREFRQLDARIPVGGVAIVDHGPSGELCTALASWARSWGSRPRRRVGLGLFGARRKASPHGRNRTSRSDRDRHASATKAWRAGARRDRKSEGQSGAPWIR
jgi:Methyltransferase domain